MVQIRFRRAFLLAVGAVLCVVGAAYLHSATAANLPDPKVDESPSAAKGSQTVDQTFKMP